MHFELPLNLERTRHSILPGERILTGRETEVLFTLPGARPTGRSLSASFSATARSSGTSG